MGNNQTIQQQIAPDWNSYSGFSAIRLWRAALLSMGVSPTATARSLLRESKDLANEYKLRKSFIRNALSKKPGQGQVHWLSEHPNNGPRLTEKMVSLASVVAYAKSKKWPIPDEMNTFWGVGTATTPQRAAAETKKNNALLKILSGVIYEMAIKDASRGFKDIVKELQLDLTRAHIEMDRTTLNGYVKEAVDEHLGFDKVVAERLSRPGNEERSK